MSKKYFGGNGSGILLIHLPISYSSLKTVLDHFDSIHHATSYGEAGSLVIFRNAGSSNVRNNCKSKLTYE
jgi:hypothetical protein